MPRTVTVGHLKADTDDSVESIPERPRRSGRTSRVVVGNSDVSNGDLNLRLRDTNESDSNVDQLSSSESEDPEAYSAVEERSRQTSVRGNKHTKIVEPSVRASARSNKFDGTMKEPTENDIGYRMIESYKRTKISSNPQEMKQSWKRATSIDEESDFSGEEDDDESDPSSARRAHANIGSRPEDDKEYKVQRVLASRFETRAKWREICHNMTTSEIYRGSRWYQEEKDGSEEQREERFLIKWMGLSYLHCSWETQNDVLTEIEGSRPYFTHFARRSENGFLYSADERLDGDYFDPAFTTIERILSVDVPKEYRPCQFECENEVTYSDYGVVTDSSDAGFDVGKGRLFQIKWASTPYSNISTECERDLIMHDIDFKSKLKEFLYRSQKPSKSEQARLETAGREEYQRIKQLMQKATVDTQQDCSNTPYQNELEEHVYKNGGQLRDYQAEGVAWLVSNYLIHKSSILADEMGLGKTIQTAAFVNIVKSKINRPGPVLIVVPLSTATNWMREFERWTDLNTILYHGSAETRRAIRELEMAFEVDRPKRVDSNQSSYLGKCVHPSPEKMRWMAQVVITTPEMMIADDATQLSSIKWEILVVDEAHRMKNHSSKTAVSLRNGTLQYNHKILLTGTPIQNDVKEFWSLLNFIDSTEFESQQDFLDKYGDLSVKERIDEMHERIRPYILRRLKEDVETSVPPKEETLIEVELSLDQKQYYRALYEKNVQFLCKKGKKFDGPSLLNLHMELRKCCNHPFLIKGAEQAIRSKLSTKGENCAEKDLLVKTSGKLILLDKLLPRLKKNGHRCLIFSQFKVMLDILEDFLSAGNMKFERIDGSIVGNKRQQAIDRFQFVPSESWEPPFVMLLSTRAGGVGINLTAADTCIIFDSDFNPQNDLQAQSRCHRIGQTKDVKVYRLLSGKTYEMKLFHMSSRKLGLDQAVLHGFETGGSGEGAMTKEEMERLLRHGAYDIFNEMKAGTAEAASMAFVEQDIDSILARRSHTVILENSGSTSKAKGGKFSKAKFAAAIESTITNEPADVDIDDQNFWEKVVGTVPNDDSTNNLPEKRARRKVMNYAESPFAVVDSEGRNSEFEDNGSGNDDSSVDGPGDLQVNTAKTIDWNKRDTEKILNLLQRYGYGLWDWKCLAGSLPFWDEKGDDEVKRMAWSLLLLGVCDVALMDAALAKKRILDRVKRRHHIEEEHKDVTIGNGMAISADRSQVELAFEMLWKRISPWANVALQDALAFASRSSSRPLTSVSHVRQIFLPSELPKLESYFIERVWPSLVDLGWKVEMNLRKPGTLVFRFQLHTFGSYRAAIKNVSSLHPELMSIVQPILTELQSLEEQSQLDVVPAVTELNSDKVEFSNLFEFLCKYAPTFAFFSDGRAHRRRSIFGWKSFDIYSCLLASRNLVNQSRLSAGESPYFDQLATRMPCHKPFSPVNAQWSSRHDAVLVDFIASHGWVGREAAFRDLMTDPNWVKLHDLTKSSNQNAPVTKALKSTAERVASFFNAHHLLMAGLDAFDTEKLSKEYGLVKSSEASGVPKWVFDEELLKRFREESTISRSNVEPPSRNDLARRAKFLLNGSLSVSAGDLCNTSSSSSTQFISHEYCVLDQDNSCFRLLAEILQVLLKISLQDSRAKLLIALAHDEAIKCHETSTVDSSIQSDGIQNIAQHIELVRISSKSSRQAKNILRVILGKEPIPDRKAKEGLFPSGAVSNAMGKNVDNLHTKSTADNAISIGIVKAREGKVSLGHGTHSDLELSAIETLILSMIASLGLPVSTEDLSEHTKLDEAKQERHMNLRFTLSWASLCTVVETAANDWFVDAKEKLRTCHEALTKSHHLPENAPEKSCLEKTVHIAEQDLKLKKSAAAQAAHYSSRPRALAMKVIMLLEKLRTKMGSVGTMASTKKPMLSENPPGPRVLLWLGQEMNRWGQSLGILDGQGRVFAFSAADFAMDATADEVGAIALLDKKSCRCIFSQVAMLTRLRSIFASNDSQTIKERASNISLSSRSPQDNWYTEYRWWGKTEGSVENDLSLMENLLLCGFSGIFMGNGTFWDDSGPIQIKNAGITKLSIQQRASWLTRELHALEETSEVMQLVERRRHKELVESPLLLPFPLSSAKSNAPKGSQIRLQKENSQPTIEKEIIELSDSSDVEIIEVCENHAKRKDENGVATDTACSPEKKVRTT